MKKMALLVLLAMGVGTAAFAQEKTIKNKKVSNSTVTTKSSRDLSSKVQVKSAKPTKAEVRHRAASPNR